MVALPRLLQLLPWDLPFHLRTTAVFRFIHFTNSDGRSLSMEYTFFNQALRERFIQTAAGMGIESRVREDKMEGSIVELSDDLPDDQLANLEAEYEALMDEQIVLAESEEGWLTHQAMGINVTLAGGQSCDIRLYGDMARRLSEHFSPEEIHELVHAIAQSIENPITGPICKKA